VNQPRWLGERTVLAIHARHLRRFGGAPGLRDKGLLDSALARPRNVHAYGEGDLFTLAATYAGGIMRNHPFVDGNKRTAFLAAALFLQKNGFRLVAPEAEAVVMTLALASGELPEAGYAAWLRDRTEAV
jgi:death-on-curing protein